MKNTYTVILVLLTITLGALQPVSAKGFYHREALATDLSTDPASFQGDFVPTPKTVDAVHTIDAVGNVLGSVGVPYASYAGEAATTVLTFVAFFLNLARSKHKKASSTIVKGIEDATTTGEIKDAIMKRALSDGTTATIHSVVSKLTK
jgi:hypothetical protein